MSSFFLGSTMGLMVGAGMMLSRNTGKLRRTMMRKMHAAMRKMKHM